MLLKGVVVLKLGAFFRSAGGSLQSTPATRRRVERAEKLAAQFEGARTQPYDSLDEWLKKADVIVSTTGATQPIVDVERF